MNERLLQYIWQFQYFNQGELTTIDGEPIQVLYPGQYNTNQGPDFSNARIRIGDTTWAGSVELHILTGDWYRHGHHHDQHYENVVLHVVWEHTGSRKMASPANERQTPPVLELQSRVPKLLLSRYEDLMNAASFIPCEKNIQSIKPLTWKSWKERLLAERLLRKSDRVLSCLQQNNNHWEETCWWLLARNFGISLNAEAFEAVARSVPLRILAKIKPQLYQVEAILLGQAGLLEQEFREPYPQLLQQEYRFQQSKYELKRSKHLLHYLRMRPGNFPAVRLAQLAMLVHRSDHLFGKIKDADSVNDVKSWITVTAGEYWNDHYRLDEPAAYRAKKTGAFMTGNIIINTIAPMLFAWGVQHDDNRYQLKALQWLEETAPESNQVIRGFSQIGITALNAFDTQALIELKNEYCSKKRCLECGVGNALLKNPGG